MSDDLGFKAWFQTHCAPRPSKKPIHELVSWLTSAEAEVWHRRELLQRCREYDARRDAAKAAWCAREEKE